MKQNLLVSVVIPVYNVEKYLSVCLDSVCGQNYQNLEILLVDDGSTDGSGRICDRYAAMDNRIKVIHQKNRGLASARNAGIEQAAGEYVYFVDSDDCLHAGLLEKAVHLAEERNANLVQVNYCGVDEDFVPPAQQTIGNAAVFEFSTEQALKNLEVDCQEFAEDIRLVTTVAWSKLYRRRLFGQVRFMEGLRIHEDQMAAHNFIIAAGGMVFCDAPFYYYRTIEKSIIRSEWKSTKLVILDCYRDRLEKTKKYCGQSDKNLVKLMGQRYLTCIFKNYIMAERYAQPEEKEALKEQLAARMKKELKSQKAFLGWKDKTVFSLFAAMPGLFVKIYCSMREV